MTACFCLAHSCKYASAFLLAVLCIPAGGTLHSCWRYFAFLGITNGFVSPVYKKTGWWNARVHTHTLRNFFVLETEIIKDFFVYELLILSYFEGRSSCARQWNAVNVMYIMHVYVCFKNPIVAIFITQCIIYLPEKHYYSCELRTCFTDFVKLYTVLSVTWSYYNSEPI